MTDRFDLAAYGIKVASIERNLSPPLLYERGLIDEGAQLTAAGAIAANSGEKTGRSPKDKRIVRERSSERDVWWGEVNIELAPKSFAQVRDLAIEQLNTESRLYVFDGFAGWDPAHQIKVRVICTRAYHALFMHNMLIRPTADELANFGEPDYVIFNAGAHPADDSIEGVTSGTCVALDFSSGHFVIQGTEYAGEMKKGVFTVMNYLMPKRGVLSMHCSANEGTGGDVTLFFGLSGTGKTTLSADPLRALIGDDEHCWTDTGVFNIEGGCYAKCIGLSAEKEPEIFDAVRFGTLLENTVQDPATRETRYDDKSLTENTRASYPIDFMPRAKLPCIGGHPKNVIFLTCDAFGVLPPVSRLSPEQAMYHYISGYTAKVAGTEVGVTEPQATFSACFGAPFLVWHPSKYAQLLADKMRAHDAHCWLINTGWTGGPHGTGSRIKLKYTRAIIDAIHDGSLADAPMTDDPLFGFAVPTACPGVPDEILQPRGTWSDPEAYDQAADQLASLFVEHFTPYDAPDAPQILLAGPSDAR